jgi:cytochrome c2
VTRLRFGLAVLAVALAACAGIPRTPPQEIPDGNPQAGARWIQQFGCGTCHSIPRIEGADAYVGPPLIHFKRRTFIAGQLPNTPDNVIRWLLDPEGVEPGTAMPDVGLTPEQARDIAAFLYTLD